MEKNSSEEGSDAARWRALRAVIKAEKVRRAPGLTAETQISNGTTITISFHR